MSQPATKTDLKRVEDTLTTKVDDFAEATEKSFDRLERTIASLTDSINQYLKTTEERYLEQVILKGPMDRLVRTLIKKHVITNDDVALG
jgi:hypothetical protein